MNAKPQWEAKPEAGGYTLIPQQIMSRTDLNAGHKIILGVLIRLQGYNALSWPSYGALSRLSGMSERQVGRIITELDKLGEIKKIRHSYKSNTYSVPWATARNLRRKYALEKQAVGTDNMS